MQSYLILFVALAVVASLAQAACPSAICMSIKCTAPAAECLTDAATMAANHYHLAAHGTSCGCCPLCVKLLQENENCASTRLLGVPLREMCDTGLKCDQPSLKCVKE